MLLGYRSCPSAPRYSLLTLLVLTALVAGGVKLWYGPHLVVEPDAEDWEAEFTYTRDWSGNRIVEGPVVFRYYKDQKLHLFDVRYYRQGVDCQWMYCCCITPESRYYHALVFGIDPEGACSLSEQERREFSQRRDEELQRISAAGITFQEQCEVAIIFQREIRGVSETR